MLLPQHLCVQNPGSCVKGLVVWGVPIFGGCSGGSPPHKGCSRWRIPLMGAVCRLAFGSFFSCPQSDFFGAALGPNAPPSVTSVKESGRKTASSIREPTFFSKVSGLNPRRFATFYRKVPKKVDWGRKKPCVSVRAWHEKHTKTGRCRRSGPLINTGCKAANRQSGPCANAPAFIRVLDCPACITPRHGKNRPHAWRVRDRGLVREIACAFVP